MFFSVFFFVFFFNFFFRFFFFVVLVLVGCIRDFYSRCIMFDKKIKERHNLNYVFVSHKPHDQWIFLWDVLLIVLILETVNSGFLDMLCCNYKIMVVTDYQKNFFCFPFPSFFFCWVAFVLLSVCEYWWTKIE